MRGAAGLLVAGLELGVIVGALTSGALAESLGMTALLAVPAVVVTLALGALKPGGIYIVADHSGRPGTGVSETKSLHRIEEAVVRREVEAAGFRLVGEGGFLRNPADPRDASVFKPRQPNDEFVLKFVKP